MMQVGATIVRDAAEQNVVVTTLDNVDGVDLHVTQVLDRGLHGALAGAEGFALVETLSVEPDTTGISPGDRNTTHLPLSHIRFVRAGLQCREFGPAQAKLSTVLCAAACTRCCR